MKQFQQHYIRMNAQLHPQPQTVERLAQKANRKRLHLPKPVKTVLLTAAVLAVSMSSLTVVSDNSAEVRQMLYSISPQVGAMFSPIMKSSVSQGIELTVEAVSFEGDSSRFVLAVRDLEDDRIKQLSMYDDYKIKSTLLPLEIASYGCSGLGYDEETETKRFMIYADEPGAGSMRGKMVTFSVQTFLLGVQKYHDITPNIDLTEVDSSPQTFLLDELHSYLDGEVPECLRSGTPSPLLDDIQLSAVGWKDGYLHIQTYCPEWNCDSGMYFWLEDAQGNCIEEDSMLSCSWNLGSRDYVHHVYEQYYTEHYIPIIDVQELQNYTIHADARTNGTYLQGNWKVKFPMVETEPSENETTSQFSAVPDTQ